LRITDFCWFAVFALRKADQRPRGDATPKILRSPTAGFNDPEQALNGLGLDALPE